MVCVLKACGVTWRLVFELITALSDRSFLKTYKGLFSHQIKCMFSPSWVTRIFLLLNFQWKLWIMSHYSTWVAVFFSTSMFSSKEHAFFLYSLNGKITNTLSRKDRACFIWVRFLMEMKFPLAFEADETDVAVRNPSYLFSFAVWKRNKEMQKRWLFQLQVKRYSAAALALPWYGSLARWTAEGAPVRGWSDPSQKKKT